MVRRVDIKYKNEFWHKDCFHYLFYQLKSQLYRYKNEFQHKACFSYLFCRLEIQIIVCLISRLTVKIQIIAEHTQL